MTSPSLPPLLTCPACQRVTPLPAHLTVLSVVRCPYCRTQFALRDLLAEPLLAWEVVSETSFDDEMGLTDSHSSTASSAETSRDSGEVRSDHASHAADSIADYTYVDPADDHIEPVSPGAKTVEMPGYQTLVEDWKEDEADEELFEPVGDVVFDSNRIPSNSVGMQTLHEGADDRQDWETDERVDEPETPVARKLEGPLVGDFPDDPPAYQSISESRKAEDSDPSQVDAYPSEDASQPALGFPVAGTQYSSLRRRSSSRHGRPRRSPIWSVLQVALGGLAAIPISLLLMWHVLGTDVGGAAPWVSQFAPWLVPQKFHPYAANIEKGDRSNQTDFVRGTTQESGASTNADGDYPTVQPHLPTEAETVSTPDEGPISGPTAPETNFDQSIPEFEAGNTSPTNSDATLEKVKDGVESTASIEDLSLESDVESDGPATEADALENCLALIRQSDERLSEWTKAFTNNQVDRPSLAQSTYAELTNLALAIDRLPTTNGVLRSVRGQLAPIGRHVQEESEVRVLLEKGAPYWVQTNSKVLTARSRDAIDTMTDLTSETAADSGNSYGLAMTVVVDSASESEDGQWWIVVPTVATQLGNPPLKLQVPRELTTPLPVDGLTQGQSLFLLGAVKLLPASVESDSSSAPQTPTFVASYLNPL